MKLYLLCIYDVILSIGMFDKFEPGITSKILQFSLIYVCLSEMHDPILWA